MPNATITSGSATISSTTYTYNSSNGSFKVTGSATISAPSVGTAGYISSSAGTRNANTATLSATVAKIAGSTAISGTTTKQPSISRQSISISNVTDAASGDAQTSVPTSGVWVKVKSDANTGTLTATPSVSTEGYGTGSYHGIGGATATVGAAASADTYIPIKTGGVSANNLGTLTKQPSISKQSISISNVTDAAAGNAQTSAPTSGVWVKVKSAANTASYTPSATKTEGWVSEGSVSGTAGTYGASESADTYVPIKTGGVSASVSTTAGSASMSATGVSTKSSSNCYITLSTIAGSATGKATIGTAGWIATGSTSSSSTAVNVSGNGDRLYLATYTPSTITVTNRIQTLTTSGKVCTGNITIPAVNYYYTSLDVPSDSQGNNGDVWLVVNP